MYSFEGRMAQVVSVGRQVTSRGLNPKAKRTGAKVKNVPASKGGTVEVIALSTRGSSSSCRCRSSFGEVRPQGQAVAPSAPPCLLTAWIRRPRFAR